MREDMSKVLVERPRIGHANGESTSRHARRTYKQELNHTGGGDDFNCGFGNTESMSANTRNHPKRNPKELNENLKPLRRFLRSRLGKPWNKVYSEIMERLNLNNAAQYHVWQHLIQLGEVETKTYMEGKTVMIADSSPRAIGDYSWKDEFYVHPKTGLLCCTESNKDRYKINHNEEVAALDDVRYIDPKKPLVQFHQIDGIWYEFQMRSATEDEKTKKQFGEFRREWDTKVSKIVYGWNRLYENKFVDQVQGRRRIPSYYYQADSLWNRCKTLFGGAYLPLTKQQIGGREVKKIEALMSARKCKKAA